MCSGRWLRALAGGRWCGRLNFIAPIWSNEVMASISSPTSNVGKSKKSRVGCVSENPREGRASIGFPSCLGRARAALKSTVSRGFYTRTVSRQTFSDSFDILHLDSATGRAFECSFFAQVGDDFSIAEISREASFIASPCFDKYAIKNSGCLWLIFAQLTADRWIMILLIHVDRLHIWT